MAIIQFLDQNASGAGGGDGGFFGSANGGDGGNGGGINDVYTGTADDQVIMGDGAGGGGGEEDGLARNGDGGLAGSGADSIDGGDGNDIIFGDAYNGADASGIVFTGPGAGGFLGGGAGGASGRDGEAAFGSGLAGGAADDPGENGQDGGDTADAVIDATNDIYNLVNGNLAQIAAGNFSDGTYGTTTEGEGAGDDILDGGAGNDSLVGNGGADTFILDGRDDDGTTDTIWDYDAGEGDSISVIDETGAAIAIDAAYTPDANAFTTATANSGSDGIVYLADGSQLVIKNFAFDTPAPCFVTGTLISTAEGQKAIESLSIGDSVCTTDGQLETIKWIGKRAVAARFAGTHSQPICIQAGALAQGTPARDLYVSPDHALFIDGVLVQAQALVNGRTITQVEMTADFTYYHIELDRHALIFAEGAETETFVDAQARGKFDNAAEFEALYPTAKAVAAMPYPRVKAKRQLPAAIKAKLDQAKTA